MLKKNRQPEFLANQGKALYLRIVTIQSDQRHAYLLCLPLPDMYRTLRRPCSAVDPR